MSQSSSRVADSTQADDVVAVCAINALSSEGSAEVAMETVSFPLDAVSVSLAEGMP